MRAGAVERVAGGAFISLAMSRLMARWMMGVKLIDPNTRDADAQELVQTVYNLARSAGLRKMPQVGVYESPEVNAFATGPSRSRSLVAVSTGLLSRMSQAERDGVLGHEIGHIANGDMVTMTLLQGIVNAFVMFLARAIAFAIANAGRNREENSGGASYGAYHLITWVLEIVFMILGSMIVAWFSRYREYRADAAGARLAGRDKMISALQKLRKLVELNNEVEEAVGTKPSLQAFKISSGRRWMHVFSTHPPLEDRIRRLESSV
jgi:heat shock protein HtpX